jgi:transketolase
MKLVTDIKKLELIANEVRQDIIKMLIEAGSGHCAGPLGIADVLVALYFEVLKHNPKSPTWPERDVFLMSNGHCAPALYATLARSGYIKLDSLNTLRKLGSDLQGHPERIKIDGIESTSGPLGCGLSQACGMALAMQMDNQAHRWVYVLMGDGELNEGNIWEAAMLANKYRLSNITAIVDRNNIQIDGQTEEVMPLNNLRDKWKSFGWHCIDVNGNDLDAVIDALYMAKAVADKPVVILAHTVPGRGVDFMEYDYHWHGPITDKKLAREALKKLRSLNGKIRSGHYD